MGERSKEGARGVVRKGLEWLEARIGQPAVVAALDGFYAGLDPEGAKRLSERSPEALGRVEENSIEWLLAEGEVEVEGRKVRASELLLGPGGPLLQAEDRQWLEGIAREPMGLYAVHEVVAGEGAWVEGIEDNGVGGRMWVEEAHGAERWAQGEVLGGRLLRIDGVFRFSDALYRLGIGRFTQLREEVDAIVRRGGAASGPIVAAWLRQLGDPPTPPAWIDGESGELVLVVRDLYDVGSWEDLDSALALREEVRGSREQGWWVCLGEPREQRLKLIRGRGGRLEAWAARLRWADAGGRWLREVGGNNLVYRTRVIADPLRVLTAVVQPESENLGPEAASAVRGAILRMWSDRPIPSLGDLSPREAMSTPEGRERLADLLQGYEAQEEKSAREQGREPTSFRFLWEGLGLEVGT